MLSSRMAKDQHSTQHISQAIRALLKTQHLKPRFDEASVVASWERIVGKSIAKRTRKVFVRNKVLFVELMSPTMKHDLSYHRTEMLAIFRREFGDDVISEIVFM